MRMKRAENGRTFGPASATVDFGVPVANRPDLKPRLSGIWREKYFLAINGTVYYLVCDNADAQAAKFYGSLVRLSGLS
jgi:hypothetical protein